MKLGISEKNSGESRLESDGWGGIEKGPECWS